MHTEVIRKIKKLRIEKGLSQIDMAEKLHIDKSAYTRLESGKTFSWAKYLEDLLNIFDITPEDFFSGIGKNIKITNKEGSYGGNVHVENLYADNQERIKKIEFLYEQRLLDKENIIQELKDVVAFLKK
jgi:transcriptional regulator with XRE-family HTH domain